MNDKQLIKLYKAFSDLESDIARYCGSRYCVLVDSCTSALFLCFQYFNPRQIILPTNTYIGVATAAYFNDIKIKFKDINWSGIYKIDPLPLTASNPLPKSAAARSYRPRNNILVEGFIKYWTPIGVSIIFVVSVAPV